MPGREHECFSRLIGFLIGLFCLEMGIEFEPLGSNAGARKYRFRRTGRILLFQYI